MNFEELKKFLESEAGKASEVTAYLQGLNPMTVEGVQKYLGENPDAMKWLESQKDVHLNKGLETWKSNNLQKLIDEAVTKANPGETPEQKQIRELTAKFEKVEKEKTYETLRNKSLKIASDKKLPVDLIDFFIGSDETVTTANLQKFEEIFSKQIDTVVKERLGSGYVPPKGKDTNLTAEEQAKAEIEKYFGI